MATSTCDSWQPTGILTYLHNLSNFKALFLSNFGLLGIIIIGSLHGPRVSNHLRFNHPKEHPENEHSIKGGARGRIIQLNMEWFVKQLC